MKLIYLPLACLLAGMLVWLGTGTRAQAQVHAPVITGRVVLLPTPVLEGMTPDGPAPPAVPSPTPVGNPAPNPGGIPFGFLPDPKAWATDLFNQALLGLVAGLATGLRQIVDQVLASPLNFISQTPPAGSYASPTVQALWGTMRILANSTLGST